MGSVVPPRVCGFRLIGVLAAALAMLFSLPASAARVVLLPETVRKGGAPIVLGEIARVKPVEKPARSKWERAQEGYAITLAMHEVLRGPLDAREIEIPFSSKGYACVWEFDSKPEPGMKILVYLASGERTQWQDYGLPGSIVRLKTFDDPVVKTQRRILAFWAIPAVEEQEKALKEGCFDADLGFRLYCVRVLTDGNLRGSAGARRTDSFLWEVFNDPRTDIETLMACDNYFWDRFRAFGWYTFEPRYRPWYAAIERHVKEEGEIHHSSFDYAVTAVCCFPGHREEVLRLLLPIIGGRKEIYKFGTTQRIGVLYEITPATVEAKQFNDRILQTLRELLSSKDPSVADGAACALGQVCVGAAKVGLSAEPARRLMSQESQKDHGQQVNSRLRAYLREAEAVSAKTKPVPLDAAPPLVLADWAAHVGERVRVVGQATYERTPEWGAAAGAGDGLLWVEGVARWPFDFPHDKTLLVTGVLSQAHDVPVFRYVKGQAFGDGLPVPEPYDLKEASRRFVLREATWELIGKGSP